MSRPRNSFVFRSVNPWVRSSVTYPRNLTNCSIRALFKGKAQEDAHEFLVALLDILREEIVETKRKLRDENENFSFPTDGKRFDNENNNNNNSNSKSHQSVSNPAKVVSNPVVDNFEMTIENSLECENCGHRSRNEESLLCLEASLASATAASSSSDESEPLRLQQVN